jgi:phage/plasmid-associated DNA primase
MDACELGEGLYCASAELNAAYLAWCEQHKRVPMKGRAFGEALREMGCEPGKTGGERCWFNITIRDVAGRIGQIGHEGSVNASVGGR